MSGSSSALARWLAAILVRLCPHGAMGCARVTRYPDVWPQSGLGGPSSKSTCGSLCARAQGAAPSLPPNPVWG